MTLIVKETISGQLVCASVAQRTSVRNVIENFLGRPRAGVATTPEITDEDHNKYGIGPTLIVRVSFASRTDADEAWAAAAGSFGLLQAGSALSQYRSTEGIDAQGQQINAADFWHIMHKPARPEDF